jgi:hypothetical protein
MADHRAKSARSAIFANRFALVEDCKDAEGQQGGAVSGFFLMIRAPARLDWSHDHADCAVDIFFGRRHRLVRCDDECLAAAAAKRRYAALLMASAPNVLLVPVPVGGAASL